jgi:hypothetical protein
MDKYTKKDANMKEATAKRSKKIMKNSNYMKKPEATLRVLFSYW